MRPGVTGLAQVSGRNNLPWERRLELDVAYVDRWSLWLDLTILARTIRLVLTRVGVSAPGVSTNVEFRGAGPEGGGA
jgi:lipopolysaccharide/colanic/teichoic acid biosynthesis glycosyltransferase